MNFLLLEKTVKFKYLRHFFKKANNSLALYLVLNQRKNLSLLKTKYNLMTMQVPNLFLNLLLDKKGQLWIGTAGNNLHKYNAKTNLFDRLNINFETNQLKFNKNRQK